MSEGYSGYFAIFREIVLAPQWSGVRGIDRLPDWSVINAILRKTPAKIFKILKISALPRSVQSAFWWYWREKKKIFKKAYLMFVAKNNCAERGEDYYIIWGARSPRVFTAYEEFVQKTIQKFPANSSRIERLLAKISSDIPIKSLGYNAADHFEYLQARAAHVRKMIPAIQIPERIAGLLKPHQTEHVRFGIAAIRSQKVFLDQSKTGTGKTYCALAIAASLYYTKVCIICPLAVVENWRRVARIFEVPVVVINYEKVRVGKFRYCRRIETPPTHEGGRRNIDFRWSCDESMLIIWDEAHLLKNSTQQGKMARRLSEQCPDTRQIFASATIGYKAAHFKNIGRALGILREAGDIEIYRDWLSEISGQSEGTGSLSEAAARAVHTSLAHCSRGMTYADIDMPAQTIDTDPIGIDDIEASEYIRSLTELERQGGSHLLFDQIALMHTDHARIEMIQQIRSQAERAKTGYIVEQARGLYEEGASVVIFVNFRWTVNTIREALEKNGIACGQITGDISREEREIAKGKFSRDELRVMLCTHQAGGTGVDLHDTIGDHHRVALHMPTWNSQDMIQSLGRIWRVGSKTAVYQKIIILAGTIEEKIIENLQAKIEASEIIATDNSFMHKHLAIADTA